MDYVNVTAYLNNRYYGVMETFEGDYDEAMNVAWEWVNSGYYVECNDYNDVIRYNPDIMHRLLERYDYVELSDCIDD